MSFSEQIYTNWHTTLKSSEDSIFFFHSNMERIIISLSIFVLSSIPIINTIEAADSLKILHIYVPYLITAWKSQNKEMFNTLFRIIMTVADGYIQYLMAYEKEYPSKKENLRTLSILYSNSVKSGCEMNPCLVQILLADLSTDGKEIYSEKIKNFGHSLLLL